MTDIVERLRDEIARVIDPHARWDDDPEEACLARFDAAFKRARRRPMTDTPLERAAARIRERRDWTDQMCGKALDDNLLNAADAWRKALMIYELCLAIVEDEIEKERGE